MIVYFLINSILIFDINIIHNEIRETDNAYIPINTYITYMRFMYHPNVLYFTQHYI